METGKMAETLTKELEQLLRNKMGPLFERYGLDIKDLLTPLKWKPVVLIIGNYSSGKSTFINEIMGSQVQRTGQAPTDDSFTILVAPEPNEPEEELPGSAVVNDERLPFTPLRHFGESLISHMRLKRVTTPILQDFAIIDTPGMLDSVTEKDRGYDYLGVVGELAKLADLIILMFDPHKAGTINETYQTIRSTLPGSTGEDRVIYVLNRIDECESVSDLLRSYGTLCWNLSQMTGRKDMPRIYLTFAPQGGKVPPPGFEIWMNEREELKQTMSSAPKMRLSHILQEVDRVVRELGLEIEAMVAFRKRFIHKFKGVVRTWGMAAILAFFFGDLVMKLLTGYPDTPLAGALLAGNISFEYFLWPIVWALLVVALASLYVQRILFPKFTKNTLKDLDNLIPLETAYKKDLWNRVKHRINKLIEKQARRQILITHGRYLRKIEHFLDKDLSRFFERI
ncbi:MAG: dynamin family protein [Deltaproteobacteria bacterium]|nr:dynamin family protein [Deltaproteobacteria bacterium]MBW1933137.1 dynamin family protein [Deltaproteobacteria bacterium]MBW2080807.1 dynamin family protein [Deltaproteobacteria bacterium]